MTLMHLPRMARRLRRLTVSRLPLPQSPLSRLPLPRSPQTRLLLTGWTLAGLMGLSACGSSGLQGDRIAQKIQDDVIKQGGTSLKSVSCPKAIKPEAGASFECLGELESGYTFTIPVKQTDAAGAVTWDIPNTKGLLNVAKLQTMIQDALQAELNTRPVVDCGGTYKPVKPGQSFDCRLDYKPADPKKDAKDGAQAGSAEGKADAKTDEKSDPKGDGKADAKTDGKPDAKDAQQKDDKAGSKTDKKGKVEKIVVTIDPQNNISWQRVLPGSPVQVAQAKGAAGTATPGTTAPGTPAAAGGPPPAAGALPPATAPTGTPAPTAEDALNQGDLPED
jgi:hypothetical protein